MPKCPFCNMPMDDEDDISMSMFSHRDKLMRGPDVHEGCLQIFIDEVICKIPQEAIDEAQEAFIQAFGAEHVKGALRFNSAEELAEILASKMETKH